MKSLRTGLIAGVALLAGAGIAVAAQRPWSSDSAQSLDTVAGTPTATSSLTASDAEQLVLAAVGTRPFKGRADTVRCDSAEFKPESTWLVTCTYYDSYGITGFKPDCEPTDTNPTRCFVRGRTNEGTRVFSVNDKTGEVGN